MNKDHQIRHLCLSRDNRLGMLSAPAFQRIRDSKPEDCPSSGMQIEPKWPSKRLLRDGLRTSTFYVQQSACPGNGVYDTGINAISNQ